MIVPALVGRLEDKKVKGNCSPIQGSWSLVGAHNPTASVLSFREGWIFMLVSFSAKLGRSEAQALECVVICH